MLTEGKEKEKWGQKKKNGVRKRKKKNGVKKNGVRHDYSAFLGRPIPLDEARRWLSNSIVA